MQNDYGYSDWSRSVDRELRHEEGMKIASAWRRALPIAHEIRDSGGGNDEVYERVSEILTEEGYDPRLVEQTAQQVEEETDPDME